MTTADHFLARTPVVIDSREQRPYDFGPEVRTTVKGLRAVSHNIRYICGRVAAILRHFGSPMKTRQHCKSDNQTRVRLHGRISCRVARTRHKKS